MILCSNFPPRADCKGPFSQGGALTSATVLSSTGSGNGRGIAEENPQGERDRLRSGHCVVFLKEAPRPEQSVHCLGDRVCGARSLGRFEIGVNDVEREDAEEV